MRLVDAHPDAIKQDLERRRQGASLREQGDELSKSLRSYIRAAWHVIQPEVRFIDSWHIGALCERLEAITRGEIRKQAFWVPPGSMKTITVSICWPTWEWTFAPWMRYLTWSYDMDIAVESAVFGRDLILSPWYQDRFGHVYDLKADLNKKAAYFNDRGGARFCAAPNAKKITGRHVDRIIADDPNDAQSVEAISDTELEKVNNFHDGALPTRFKDPKRSVEIIIQQRLHESDLSGHLVDDAWEVLCLPERYDPKHQFVWPDDPRSENELLWPDRIGEAENLERRKILGAHRASGQLQQEPSSREGEILRRSYWNYYPAELLDALEEGDASGFPKFNLIVCSWDTAFKDKTTNDPVAGGAWGIIGPDRYLLRTFYDRASLPRTKTEMLAMREWAVARWPRAGIYTLIEKKSNGVEIIAQLRREVPGVKPYNPGNLDKSQRAISAEPDLDSGNVFIAGEAMPPHDELGRGSEYVPLRTPAWAQEVIEQCARFPKGKHDDLVDMTTQAINWVRTKGQKRSRVYSPMAYRLPEPAGIPTGSGRMLGS